MRLEMDRFLKDKEQLVNYFAQENIVPVKSPPWAEYPFELRRNEKTKRGQIGRQLLGTKTTPLIMEFLDIHDEQSCRRVRQHIRLIQRESRHE